MKIRGIWKALFWLNWAYIAWFWFQGSSALFASGTPGVLISLGRLSGLSAAYFVLLQFITTGRILWIERSFGMDKLTRTHQRNGKFALGFIVLHPILLTLGYGMASDNSFVSQFLIFLAQYDDVFSAFFGFLLFLILVGISLAIIRSRLKYETWYYVHLLMYAAVFLSYEHQFEIGPTLAHSTIFYGYWLLLYLSILISFGVFRFLLPLYNFNRHRFRVAKIVRETPTTVSIYITGRAMEKFAVEPGQFMLFRFLNKKMWAQSHPFSLSVFPDGRQIRITVKELGDFTAMIQELKENTPVIIEGPYGMFTGRVASSNKILLIAGGIGITPIRSLFEEFSRKNSDVVLIYGNRTQSDVPLRGEVEALAREYKKTMFHVMSAEPEFSGEKGYVDEERLKRLVPDLISREIYVCGPPTMMDSVIKVVKELGVPPSQIHFERFAF